MPLPKTPTSLACMQYIREYTDEHKYFTFTELLKERKFEMSDLFGAVRVLCNAEELKSVKYSYHLPDIDAEKLSVLYTKPAYADCPEIKAHFSALGIDEETIKQYIIRLKMACNEKTRFIAKSQRRKNTIRDIELKNEIIQYIRSQGNATFAEITSNFDTDPARIKTLVTSLAVGKYIMYDKATKSYIALTARY